MPPASVRSLASKMTLLPLLWASDEDYILLPDNRTAKVTNPSEPLPWSDFGLALLDHIEPWGWNRALMTRLQSLGVPDRLLPSSDILVNLRRLSHRRISIEANRFLNSPFVPSEFTRKEDAMNFYIHNPGCFFKLPWSSGGRGVVATKDLKTRQVEEWISGAIRRQGSVMAEIKVDRVLDFASLWSCSEGKVYFKGFSISKSDGRGKYDGNISAPQSTIESLIRKVVKDFSGIPVSRQKDFILSNIAPYYNGRLGIDMMVDSKGTVYPCVEINLRNTMGHAAMNFWYLSSVKRSALPTSITDFFILNHE